MVLTLIGTRWAIKWLANTGTPENP